MTDKSDIEAFLEMVPFYVNGSLDDADRRAFETTLATSDELQREVDREETLQARFNSGVEAELEQVSESNDRHIQSLIDPASGSAEEDDNRGLAGALSFLNPVNWKPAVTLAIAAAAVGQVAIIGSQADTIDEQNAQIAGLEKRNFELASGKCDCDAETTIILEPSGDADWTGLNALISAEGLAITGGGFGGPLMLRHSDETESLEEILERLNASPLVDSAMEAS